MMLCSAALCRAQSAPTTLPSNDVSSLIAHLDDPDFHVRRDASNRLRAMGAEALPALKQALSDPNPEVRARAAEIVHVLEFRHVPGRPANHTHLMQVRISEVNGERSVEVDDSGRHIQIAQGADGIRMTVTGELDGHPATETYTAKSPEQLKSDNPEAYAVYQRCQRQGGADWETGGALAGNLIVRGNGNVIVLPPMQIQPMVRAGGDNIVGLRVKVDDAMARAHLPADQQKRIHDAMDEVEQSRQFTPVGPVDQTDQNIRAYDRACDTLRKELADAKLPDPGDALPPPKGARLGISVAPDFAAGGGLLVSHVVQSSRADRIGLQEDDRIRRINGTDVSDVKDLRRLVTEHAKGLVLEITRDGRDMKLEEK